MSERKYETLGEVEDGALRLKDRERFVDEFRSWPDGLVWATFQSALLFRSKGQNRYWHGAIVRPLAAHSKVSPRLMHEALKVLLLPTVVPILGRDGTAVQTLTVGGSTTQLTKNEAANLIDRAEHLLETCGLRERIDHTHFIPHDEPKMGRQQRALCGALVLAASHRVAPSCPHCRTELADDDEVTW